MRVGDRVEARDSQGIWYRAKIVEVRGSGEVRVHFHGWAPRFDEWMPAGSPNLRPPSDGEVIQDERVGDYDRWDGHIDEDTWEVERVLKRRRRLGAAEFLVKWAGWDENHNSWVPEDDISEDLLENLDLSVFGEPYVCGVEQGPHVAPEMAAELAAEWKDEIGRAAAQMLKRSTTEEYASRRVMTFKPCPPWLFMAIHAAINQVASECEGDATDKVSNVVGVKGTHGGKYVVDRFDVLATEVVEALVGPFNTCGHGSLAFRQMNTAVMLFPPLTFTFKTTRSDGVCARKYPTELSLTGHFTMLVDRKASNKSPVFKFDEERAIYDATLKLAYKKAMAAAMRELGPKVVPKHLLRFLQKL